MVWTEEKVLGFYNALKETVTVKSNSDSLRFFVSRDTLTEVLNNHAGYKFEG